jgi:hypothetical protein
MMNSDAPQTVLAAEAARLHNRARACRTPGKELNGLRWWLGILAALAVAILSLYPQLDLWRTQRANERAPFVTLEFDEVAYSAYVNALANGRPRRNDPYTGLNDSPQSPQPETLFSVQFIPPYLLAVPARLFGLSTSTVFILLAPLSAFASALALFWLLGPLTRDDRAACAGTIFILCMGSLAGTPGALRTMLHLHDPFTLLPFLPFLRRYEPAVPFPIYLVFCTFVFAALNSESRRVAARRAVCAGLAFACLVFSYFYLWTAALAWLACIATLWFIFRRDDGRPVSDDRRRALFVFGIIVALAFAALVPYALLLSHRAPATDMVQLLVSTHAPDLFRLTELLAALVSLALVAAAWRGLVKWRDGSFLFALSFALMPFVCFNQQIVTGLSLQPVHYEKLIANYCVLVAAVVMATLLWRGIKGATVAMPRAFLVAVAVVSLAWASAETVVQSRINRRYNVMRAQMQPLASRLNELARGVPTGELSHQVVVFTPTLLQIQADSLPTDAPQPVLWAPHAFVFSGVTWREYKERLYQNLYYAGVDERRLNALLRGDGGYLRFVFIAYQAQPITPDTIPREIQTYVAYASTFDRTRAAQTKLAYLVTAANDDADLSNLDRFYKRDAGERVGELTLYRLKLRE